MVYSKKNLPFQIKVFEFLNFAKQLDSFGNGLPVKKRFLVLSWAWLLFESTAEHAPYKNYEYSEFLQLFKISSILGTSGTSFESSWLANSENFIFVSRVSNFGSFYGVVNWKRKYHVFSINLRAAIIAVFFPSFAESKEINGKEFSIMSVAFTSLPNIPALLVRLLIF